MPSEIGTAVLRALAIGPPITRDDAQRAAEAELRKAIYRADDPSLQERLLRWLAERISALLEQLAERAPGGLPGALALLLVFLALIVAVRLRIGPLARSNRLTDRRAGARAMSATDYRAEAERFAAAAAWAEAVRARFRAIARGLEERGVLDPRPGRTADEVALDASVALPGLRADLRAAASAFDGIWYGGRAAAAADYSTVSAADDAVRSASMRVAGSRA